MNEVEPSTGSSETQSAGCARGQRLALGALLAALVAWGGWFVWQTSFTVDGRRAFCLFDDAMISMTYARNLVDGHGLGWARYGEPVEGFTHPLWTAVMVLVQLAPLSLLTTSLTTSLVVQLVSLATLLATVVATVGLVRRHFASTSAWAWLSAALATAFCYPLAHWALQGMECGLQALLLVLGVRFALDLTERDEPRELALACVLALGYLLRMDTLVPGGAIVAWVALRGGFRATRRRAWLGGAGLLVLVVLAYQAFRVAVFGEWLPNTYYLKLAGIPLEVRWLRGLETLATGLRPMGLVLLAVGLGVAWSARRAPRVLLPALVFLASALYSVHVGGDAWEKAGIGANRFVAPALPLVFVLASALLERVLVARRGPRTGPALPLAVGFALVLASNGLVSSDAERWRRFLVRTPPLHAAEHAQLTREVLALQASGVVAPEARVAVIWAGIPAYFSDWEMVDFLGYNDRVVAREPPVVPLSRANFRSYQPGHVKVQHEYSLRTHRPDFVYQIRGLAPASLAALMAAQDYVERDGFWFRRDSTRVAPERLAEYRERLAASAR